MWKSRELRLSKSHTNAHTCTKMHFNAQFTWAKILMLFFSFLNSILIRKWMRTQAQYNANLWTNKTCKKIHPVFVSVLVNPAHAQRCAITHTRSIYLTCAPVLYFPPPGAEKEGLIRPASSHILPLPQMSTNRRGMWRHASTAMKKVHKFCLLHMDTHVQYRLMFAIWTAHTWIYILHTKYSGVHTCVKRCTVHVKKKQVGRMSTVVVHIRTIIPVI